MTKNIIASGVIHCPVEEFDTIIPAIKEHVRLSNAEPGCIRFAIDQDDDDPTRFNVDEEFESRAAFDLHTKRTRASLWWEISQHLKRDITVKEKP